MVEKLTIDFSNPLPLFPLPGCVLLPHATVPLHIFEDRYRQLIRDVLDSHGLVAMALLDTHDQAVDSLGRRPVRSHVCIGYTIRHERLPDGRYNLLLQGICRARIREEIDHEPYRAALLEPTEPQPPMEIDMGDHRQRIEELLGDPLLRELASVSAIHNWLSAEIPTAALIDLAIMTFCGSVETRYAMLAESDTFARAQWLQQHLWETRRTLATAERFRREALADGIYLN